MSTLTARLNTPRLPATVDITLPTGWDGTADVTPVDSAALVTALVRGAVEAALASNHYIIELDKDTVYTGSFVLDHGGLNEFQRITISGIPTGGTFTLSFDGQGPTVAIAYNANALKVQTALEGLSNISSFEVFCSRSLATGTLLDIKFYGGLATTDVAEITVDDALLTGGSSPTATITTLVDGRTGYTGTNSVILRTSGFASLPAVGTRITTDMTNHATMLTEGTTPVMRVDLKAHHIAFVGIEFQNDQNNGLNIMLGVNSSFNIATVLSDMGQQVGFNWCRIHNISESLATREGIQVSMDHFYIVDSRIDNIKSTGEAQAILFAATNGPIHVENNYLESAGENVMFGGNDLVIKNQQPHDITFVRNYLFKPDKWNKRHADFNEHPDTEPNINFISVTNTDIDGREELDGLTTITTANANIAITAITESSGFTSIQKTGHALVVNQWITVAGVTPSGYNTSHKVTAVTDANNFVTSVGFISNSTVHGTYRPLNTLSAEFVIKLEATVPTGYRGRHSIVHLIDDDSFVTNQTYTSDSTTAGTYRELPGWKVKNTFEIKTGVRCRFAGNVVEGSWRASQVGYAIVLTPGRNITRLNDWHAVQDILIENCVIKRAGRGILELSDDDIQQSDQTKRITIRNCLFHTIGGTVIDDLTEVFGVGGEFFAFGKKFDGRPLWDLFIDHCTFVFQEGHLGNGSFTSGNTGTIEIKNFTLSNCIFDDGNFEDLESAFDSGEIVNLSVVNNGIFYNPLSSGYSTKIVDGNFEDNFNNVSWGSGNIKANTITLAKFTDNANQDYTLAGDSPFKGIGTDGRNAGVDFAELNAAIAGVAE